MTHIQYINKQNLIIESAIVNYKLEVLLEDTSDKNASKDSSDKKGKFLEKAKTAIISILKAIIGAIKNGLDKLREKFKKYDTLLGWKMITTFNLIKNKGADLNNYFDENNEVIVYTVKKDDKLTVTQYNKFVNDLTDLLKASNRRVLELEKTSISDQMKYNAENEGSIKSEADKFTKLNAAITANLNGLLSAEPIVKKFKEDVRKEKKIRSDIKINEEQKGKLDESTMSNNDLKLLKAKLLIEAASLLTESDEVGIDHVAGDALPNVNDDVDKEIAELVDEDDEYPEDTSGGEGAEIKSDALDNIFGDDADDAIETMTDDEGSETVEFESAISKKFAKLNRLLEAIHAEGDISPNVNDDTDKEIAELVDEDDEYPEDTSGGEGAEITFDAIKELSGGDKELIDILTDDDGSETIEYDI